ncbi:hypothetical protein ONZ45_g15325 [Pleurotus djamor]|nr:hypothetical protein ONZ45_g15325 [Pleurotus djamor]
MPIAQANTGPFPAIKEVSPTSWLASLRSTKPQHSCGPNRRLDWLLSIFPSKVVEHCYYHPYVTMTSGRIDPPSGVTALPDIQQLIQFMPGRNMSYADLLAFIRSLQTRIEQVAAENEGYRSEVATLKAEGMAKVRRGKKKAVVGAPSSDVDEGNLLRLGKEFAILHDIWIDKLGRSLSHLPTVLPGGDSSDSSPPADRYSSFETYKNGLAFELVQFLPAKYGIVVLGHCSSQDGFYKGASEIRTHAARVVRNTAARIFKGYNIPQELWDRGNGANRAASPLLQAFLMFAGTLKQPMFPPILFFNIKKREIAMIFLNPIILRIMRVVLFGPKSLDSPNVTTASIGKLWNIVEPSSGLIAFCAVLAIYMCYFSETGANSRTDYYKLFYEYKKLLSVEPRTPHLQQIYDRISQYVFKGISGSASQDAEDFGSLTDPEDEADEIAGVLHSLTGLGHPHAPTPTPAVSEDEPGSDNHHEVASCERDSKSDSDSDTGTTSSTASNNEEDVPLSTAYVGFNGVGEDEDEDDTDALENDTNAAEVAVYQTQVALAQPAASTHSAHIMSRTIPIAARHSFANQETGPFVSPFAAQQGPFTNHELGPIPGPSHLQSAHLVHFLQSASTGNPLSSRLSPPPLLPAFSPPPLLPAFDAAPPQKGKGRGRGKRVAAPAPNTAVDEGTVRRVSKRNKAPCA